MSQKVVMEEKISRRKKQSVWILACQWTRNGALGLWIRQVLLVYANVNFVLALFEIIRLCIMWNFV